MRVPNGDTAIYLKKRKGGGGDKQTHTEARKLTQVLFYSSAAYLYIKGSWIPKTVLAPDNRVLRFYVEPIEGQSKMLTFNKHLRFTSELGLCTKTVPSSPRGSLPPKLVLAPDGKAHSCRILNRNLNVSPEGQLINLLNSPLLKRDLVGSPHIKMVLSLHIST